MTREHLIRAGIDENIVEILLGKKEIETLEEAKRIYNSSVGKTRAAALDKAVKLMDSFEKAQTIYFNYSANELRIVALIRAGELVTTFEHAKWVHEVSTQELKNATLAKDSKLMKTLSELEITTLTKASELIKTLEDARCLYWISTGELQVIALDKAIKLMDSFEKAVETYHHSKDELKVAALEFLKEM